MLKDKYKIETLPVADDFLRGKRLIQARGELTLLSDCEEIRHITFFTRNPGPGYYRGGQYHKKKTERSCLISGQVQLLLTDVENNENTTIELAADQRATIYSMCAHRLEAITEAQVIEYYSKPFDLLDDIRFEGFDEGDQ